jgi:hypothetical protein
VAMFILLIHPCYFLLSTCDHSTFTQGGPTCQKSWKRNSKIIGATRVRTLALWASKPQIVPLQRKNLCVSSMKPNTFIHNVSAEN